MDQQQRLFLTLVLSFGLIFVFQQFVWGPQMEADNAKLAALDAGAHAQGLAALDGGAAPVAVAGETPQLVAGEDGGADATAPLATPKRTLEEKRPTMALAFTSEGASLTDATLLGPRERQEEQLSIPEGFKKLFGAKIPPPPQIRLAQPPQTGAGQLDVSIAGATPFPVRQPYAVTEEAPGKLVFTAQSGPWQVIKTYTWNPTAPAAGTKVKEKSPEGYEFSLDVAVKNTSAQPATGQLVVHTARGIDPAEETAPSMFGGIGNQSSVVCRVADSIERETPKKEDFTKEHSGQIHFVGIDQQYFLTAVWPKDGPVDGKCGLTFSNTLRGADLAQPLTVAPGESVTKHFGIFMGPKDEGVLMAVGRAAGAPEHEAAAHPGLERSINYGMWAVIAKALNFFLRFFHALLGNWGLAIILLTVMVKLVLLPLTHKSMVSAESMKKLQPQMEVIRQKYPDDRERQNMEMMKLYQEAKVNPLGGCLPLLVQLPIWGALFTTLRTSYELYGEPFYGVWSDLTSKDPTYLLPLALGVTMIVTQRLQPQMMDKSQVFLMTWVMPIFFTAIMMNYPAGLSLYIFTNNILSIIQQFALRRYLERTGVSAPKANAKA
jgi:YidC/Oxa1 family membrane protein insertase